MSYKGETKNGLRHGKGEYIYPNGFFKYVGEWNQGIKEGIGKFILKDGTEYEGQFVDGEMTGTGKKKWQDGRYYEGCFLEGELSGPGILTNNNTGETCEGTWQNNRLQGLGRRVFPNGNTYTGPFERHRAHGSGKYVGAAGDVYVGEFSSGNFGGTGTKTWRNGDVYEGQWEAGRRVGEGRFVEHGSGFIFEGLWIDDKPAISAAKLSVKYPIESPMFIDLTELSLPTIQVSVQTEDGVTVPESSRKISLSLMSVNKSKSPVKQRTHTNVSSKKSIAPPSSTVAAKNSSNPSPAPSNSSSTTSLPLKKKGTLILTKEGSAVSLPEELPSVTPVPLTLHPSSPLLETSTAVQMPPPLLPLTPNSRSTPASTRPHSARPSSSGGARLTATGSVPSITVDTPEDVSKTSTTTSDTPTQAQPALPVLYEKLIAVVRNGVAEFPGIIFPATIDPMSTDYQLVVQDETPVPPSTTRPATSTVPATAATTTVLDTPTDSAPLPTFSVSVEDTTLTPSSSVTPAPVFISSLFTKLANTSVSLTFKKKVGK